MLLKRLDRRTKALAIIDGPAAPRAWVYAVSCGGSAALVSYFLMGTDVADQVQALIVGLASAVACVGLEQWSIRRRLEATIEILKLGPHDSTADQNLVVAAAVEARRQRAACLKPGEQE